MSLRLIVRRLTWIALKLTLLLAASLALAQESPPAVDASKNFQNFAWEPSLPLGFGDPAITPIGGTELRTLAVFDDKLFAGVGYWSDIESKNAALPGAQVLRLDAADAKWQVDFQLDERDPWQVKLRKYFAISFLQPVRFTIDDEGRALDPPADLLLAAVWSHNVGVDVFVRQTGSASWTAIPIPGQETARRGFQVRSFLVHQDRKTGAEMVFAGGSNTIFVGRYNRLQQNIVWQAKPDWTGEIPFMTAKS